MADIEVPIHLCASPDEGIAMAAGMDRALHIFATSKQMPESMSKRQTKLPLYFVS
ncbi:hypothetical protein [Comamonas odontotermitis]|uniref:hypothetical protein n=1 Tax=Comamonas odontotermitis TaxID=379895 RepID=UPI001CC49CD0|nr:hypothetical protein [Comamonas odontotermitis]UBB18936.1 hypothetical protein LAD35_10085 [Comamonas odontotermitis]